MKKIMLFLVLGFLCLQTFAQTLSPEDFLGYKVGEHFTPHHKIVDYFKHVTEKNPSLVKLKSYGETNERRPLYLAYISSAENIKNLENIRENNLALAQMGNNKTVAENAAPAVVWLSYNVHGNEASSSEAAMLTIYELVKSGGAASTWLQNTVIVMDPCLNPDGRERYVNWFNGVVGKNPNKLLVSREHREPWPGGRSNHYNFDLNRDWAWQTQVETQQRMFVYNRWLPQVHVDFHEQGINNPYYFAPAAQPYHEVLTEFQRSFQQTIGKANAEVFDKNNWLFFTKEYFDLLYPSYGDTYPLYNGSIGMTYEQAGGPAGGLIAEKELGDSLTLTERALHHYYTGITTIKTASENKAALINNFSQFFNDAVNGNVGIYKTYILKYADEDAERINDLKNLLDKNGITYGTGSGKAKGYNYFTQKEESFSIENNDLVISSAQPKAAMLKVLFEPQTKLVDSATYDITAWALPYAYGIKAFASKDKIAVKVPEKINVVSFVLDNYGYVLKWDGMKSAKAMSQLLQKGIRLRFAEKDFTSNGRKFNRGSILILKSGNPAFHSNLFQVVNDIASEENVDFYSVTSGLSDVGPDFGSDKMIALKSPNVAMLTGDEVSSLGAGEIWNFFDNDLKYPLTLINAKDAARMDWNAFDVVIMPDGYYSFLDNKNAAAGLERWISAGGKLIALEGAVGQLSNQEWSSVKAKKNKEEDKEKNVVDYHLLSSYKERENNYISNNTPGAIFKVEIDNSHPLMFGYPNYYYTLKTNPNLYSFMDDGGWNVGVLKKAEPVSGFVGYKLDPVLKDGWIFGVQNFGRGSITYLTDDVLFRNFWQNGKLIMVNAVFLVGQ